MLPSYWNAGLLDLNSSLQTILTYKFEGIFPPSFLLPSSVAIANSDVL